jgi:energy-coupling factor transport system ATP-binding protein
MAMEPRYLILDEATAMLDPVSREEILQKIQQLRQEKGLAIVHITHLVEEAFQAERLLLLKAGRLLFCGQPLELIHKEEVLAEVGFKIPVIMALAKALRRQGYDLPVNLLSAEELARALWKLSSRM